MATMTVINCSHTQLNIDKEVCQCGLSRPAANPHSRSLARNRPTFLDRGHPIHPCHPHHPDLYTRCWSRMVFDADFATLIRTFGCWFRWRWFDSIVSDPEINLGTSAFLHWFFEKRARYSLVHILRTSSSKSAPNVECVLTQEFTRFRTVALPNYLLMGGWHDDGWLTWWCGSHGGKLIMTLVNS